MDAALPAVELRDGTRADIETISALAIHVFLATYAIDGIRPDIAREAFTECGAEALRVAFGDAARRFVVAQRGTGLVGFAEMRVGAHEPPVTAPKGAELVRLYVQPSCQRMGVGQRLIRHVEMLAAQAELPAVWLTAWDGNQRALGFYRAMGYEDVGSTPHVFEEQVYGNRVLVRRLDR